MAPPRRSLWYGGAHSLASSVLSLGASIAVSVVVARALAPAPKGVYNLVMVAGGLLALVFGLSLGSGMVYVVARGAAAAGALFVRLALLGLAQTALAVGVAYALGPLLLPPQAGAWALPTMALLVYFGLLAGYLRGALLGLHDIPGANRINPLSQLLALALILAAVGAAALAGRDVEPAALVWAQVAAAGLTCLVVLAGLWPALRDTLRGASGLGAVLGYALPSLHLASLAQVINLRLDVFVVGYFVGAAGVGLYTLAVSLAQLIWLVPSAAAQVLLPNVAADADRAAAGLRAARAARMALWAGVTLALALALAAELLVPLVFGEPYRAAAPALRWLLPGVVLYSLPNVLGAYLSGVGRPQLNLAAALVGLVATVALDLLLIPALGIVGAALASSVAYAASAAVATALFARESGLPLRAALWPTRADVELVAEVVARRVGRAGDGGR